MDLATLYHCVPKRDYISTYKAGDFGTVKMENKYVSHITGIGDICIQTIMGCTLTLNNVRHILDLHLNPISIHMMDKDGYNHFINSSKWKLTKGSLVVVFGNWCSYQRLVAKSLTTTQKT